MNNDARWKCKDIPLSLTFPRKTIQASMIISLDLVRWPKAATAFAFRQFMASLLLWRGEGQKAWQPSVTVFDSGMKTAYTTANPMKPIANHTHQTNPMRSCPKVKDAPMEK